MSLDSEYFQVVNSDSGYALKGLDRLPNKESAKTAAREAALSRQEPLAVVKVTIKTVATFQRDVTVTAVDIP